MVLLFCLLVRICYCVNKNSIGYAYGYQGIGIQANNPVFELSTAFPKIKLYYGIIASLMFSVAYACSNIFMSDLSKGWNKKWMLGIGVLGFASSSMIAGVTNSLVIFAIMRFTFGVFASAINAPIYQLIAANFPVEYRTSANAVENTGYHLGAGVASFMALIIRAYGWRTMYMCMGSFAFMIGVLILLLVKNPVMSKS